MARAFAFLALACAASAAVTISNIQFYECNETPSCAPGTTTLPLMKKCLEDNAEKCNKKLSVASFYIKSVPVHSCDTDKAVQFDLQSDIQKEIDTADIGYRVELMGLKLEAGVKAKSCTEANLSFRQTANKKCGSYESHLAYPAALDTTTKNISFSKFNVYNPMPKNIKLKVADDATSCTLQTLTPGNMSLETSATVQYATAGAQTLIASATALFLATSAFTLF